MYVCNVYNVMYVYNVYNVMYVCNVYNVMYVCNVYNVMLLLLHSIGVAMITGQQPLNRPKSIGAFVYTTRETM